MEATLNRMGGGHTLQSYSLGARDKCPHHQPQISEICLVLVGAQKCKILHDQTTGDLESHHLQAGPHSQPCQTVPPRPPFLSGELWVICYLPILHYCIYWQYHIYPIIREKKFFLFFLYIYTFILLGHSQPLRGGGWGEVLFGQENKISYSQFNGAVLL